MIHLLVCWLRSIRKNALQILDVLMLNLTNDKAQEYRSCTNSKIEHVALLILPLIFMYPG